MILDSTELVLDWEGNPVVESGKPLLYRNLVAMSLAGENSVQFSADEKGRAFALLSRFYQDGKVTVDLDEAAFIKRHAAVVLATFGYGRLAAWLEAAAGPTADLDG